ncbi:MAG TPA: hypothetical protein VHB02_14520 [Acidimicrobiales bacterium]|nr:hypothetical protein [Acidimicrobiales bacterium]
MADAMVRLDLVVDPVTVVVTVPEAVVQVEPPSVDICQVAVGAGVPVAVAVKCSGDVSLTVGAVGCAVTAGATSTATVTEVDMFFGTDSVPFHVAVYVWLPADGTIVRTAVPADGFPVPPVLTVDVPTGEALPPTVSLNVTVPACAVTG